MNDQTPPVPLTEEERKRFQEKAERGEFPTLEIVRRFIATIRTSITNSPKKMEKTAKTRVVKKPVSEQDVEGFF